ncbi:hypothetical protein [Stutzerimonas kirkiae]|uniref:Uncharacterized protein n=1 Tax=Stutzerimonas kirkiae TaxID=2211392 RepID=A0A4Q9RF76_9GAMM|nr:hypothetical protein [Stutzerimonas kirkiae]TBU99851.1 hypothetical protein DNJ96_00705 [Stutzerimonas kirkiae]TBV05345.1 hypothetical protein DNJ95_03090 [Stutzerimonas kirkiae]TBV08155.1 hypothetical protein DNK08_11305 [Stutzerimonas kirkiae]TBV17630.1 hypothetical protein DNK01_01630 [Stutzerimonas kirkiae]
MKLSDRFDARRLRPRKQKQGWRWCLGALLAFLIAAAGLAFALSGALLLFDRGEVIAMQANRATGSTLLIVGVLLLWGGISFWRRLRRRMRQTSSLSLSPDLMKKRD